MECKYTGKPRKQKRGSTKTEFFMWMIFPFGIPYTMWRMLTKMKICRHCDSKLIYDTTSLQGHKMVTLIEAELNGGPMADFSAMKANPSQATSTESKLNLPTQSVSTAPPPFEHPSPPPPRERVAPDPSVW